MITFGAFRNLRVQPPSPKPPKGKMMKTILVILGVAAGVAALCIVVMIILSGDTGFLYR